MLQNIDMKQLQLLKIRDPEFAQMIDDLLLNHKKIVSTISHELRNPLALISSSLQLLASRFPEVKNFKHWEATTLEVEYMKFLLKDLSSFNNSAHHKRDQVDMYDFCHQLAETFDIAISNTEIEFSSNIPEILPFVLGDYMKLHEVFINIFQNATDAVDTDGKITFSAYQEFVNDTPYFVGAITDNGCGIPPECIDSIFELFTTYKVGGSGLGLSIAQNIISAHSGHIEVKSAVNEGTSFLVRLPVHYH